MNWNSDAIYLGININGDGEMVPRRRFGAAPQAFNASQLQGMYASGTIFGATSLFVVNQTSATAATGTRTALEVRSSGTGNQDYLFRAVNDLLDTVFSIDRAGGVTTTNVTSTNLYVSGTASTTQLYVSGQLVCLATGTNCQSSSGAQTLAQVTARGTFSTSTLQLYGGFIGSSSTVTSTLVVLGGTTLQDATATNVTTTNLYVSNVASTSQLFVGGQLVCLVTGTNCLAKTDLNWTYDGSVSAVRNATPTTDILLGSTATSTGAPVYFDLSGGTSGTSTAYFGFATNTNVVINGTSTTQTGLNSLFLMDGNDLFVGGSIGSVSSVYTNGAFVAGPGSTYFGNGFITKNDGALTVQTTAGTNVVNELEQLFDARFTPTLIGTTTVIPKATKFVLSGTYAYVIGTNNDFVIVDLSDPSAPTIVSTLSLPVETPTSIDYDGTYVYVSMSSSQSVEVIDVTNKAAPSITRVIYAAGNSVKIGGHYLYGVDSFFLNIFDLAASSTYVGRVAITGANRLALYGEHAYVLGDDLGAGHLSVVDIRNPNAPSVTATYDFVNAQTAIAVKGRYAYLTDSTDGVLRIVNVGSDTVVSVVSTTTISGANSVFVSDRYAYVDDTANVIVVDVASSTAPNIVNTFTGVTASKQFATYGRYGVLVGGSTGAGYLQVYDMKGTEVQSLTAHTIETGSEQISGTLGVSGETNLYGGLRVGVNGLLSYGSLNVLSTNTTSTFLGAVSTTRLTVLGQGVCLASGTNCPSMGAPASTSTFASVTAVGSFTNTTLQLYGGFIGSSSTVTSTLTVLGGTTLQDTTSTNATTTNLYVSGTASTSQLYVSGQLVCLASGTNCQPSSGAQTLAQVTALGSFTTNTLQLYGGFIGSSSTVTSTFTVLGGTSLQDTTSTNATTTNLYVSGTASTSQLYVSGQLVCLASGTNCAAAASSGADLNWTFDGSVDAVRNATATTDIILGSTATSTGAPVYFDLSGGTAGTSTVYFGFATNTNVVINGTSSTQTGLNSLFVMNGNDLFVGGNIGSVSSVYTNGAFIAGPGSTYYGNGFITKNDAGPLTLSAVSGTQTDTSLSFTYSSTSPMSVVGTTTVTTLPWKVKIQGDYAYVLDTNDPHHLSIIDISNPSSPSTTANLWLGGTYAQPDFDVSGNYAYFPDYTLGGMNIVDIHNPDSPFIVSTSTNFTNPTGVRVSGKYAYVAEYGGRLKVVDISDPANPVVVGTTSNVTMSSMWFMAQQGSYVYAVPYSGSSLWTIDVSDPAHPFVASTLTINDLGQYHSLEVEGSYVYIGDASANELVIVDVMNPRTPKIMFQGSVTGGPSSILNFKNFSVNGRYLYSWEYNSTAPRLQVIDINNRNNPVHVRAFATGGATNGGAAGIDVSGKYAVISNNTTQVAVVDLGGIETTSLLTHSLQTASLNVLNSASIQNALSIGSGLTVGASGIQSLGAISVYATNTTSTFYGTVSTTRLFVNGQTVCLTDGTSCTAAAGSDTLATVTARGSSATTTLQLYAGFITSSSTVTSTLNVAGRLTAPYLNRWFQVPLLNQTIYQGGNATVTVGNQPEGIAFDGSYVWVANNQGSSVSKVDPITNTVVATVGVGAQPRAIVFDGNYIWVSNQGGAKTISKIDPNTNTVVATTTMGTTVEGLAFDGNYIWLANYSGATVTKISPTTSLVIATSTASGNGPYGVAFGNGFIWVTNALAGTVDKINILTVAVVDTVTVGATPRGIAFDGEYLWVANYGDATVSKIDTRTVRVVATIPLQITGAGAGTTPEGVVFDGRNIWVSHGGTATLVSTIDPMTNAVVATSTAGSAPWGIASDGSHVWVTNSGGSTLTKIPIGVGSGVNENFHVNLVPDTNSTFDLGTSSLGWRNLYATNATHTSLYVSGTASTSQLYVGGSLVCLTNGTNCPASSAAQTLAQVTALGSSATTTLQLYGGFVTASSTVTSTLTVGGRIFLADGSNTAPSLLFSSDAGLNSGMYSRNDGSFGFTVDGGEQLRLLAGTVRIYNAGLDLQGNQIALTGTISPNTNNSSNLGSGTLSYRNIYASGTVYAVNVTATAIAAMNPINPSIATTTHTPGQGTSVVVSDGYAYVADGTYGLEIYDVSNPLAPRFVSGTSDGTGNSAVSVFISGNTAYVSQANGLLLYDISDPSNPTILSTYTGGSCTPQDAYVVGRYAYLACNLLGFEVVDVSNPVIPRLVYQDTNVKHAFGIFVQGQYAYIADGTDGLTIVDISDPTAPVIKATTSASANFHEVTVSGAYAYLADQTSNLVLTFDITSSTNPLSIATTTFAAVPRGVDVSGNYLYVGADTAGLTIIDVSDPYNPKTISTISDGNAWQKVHTYGKYVFAGAGAAVSGGYFNVVDIGGADLSSARIGDALLGTVSVTTDAEIGNHLSVRGGLEVGSGGILSTGGLNVSASDGSSTARFVNLQGANQSGTNWGMYANTALVGSNKFATGTVNYSMVITYVSSSAFGGLCIDDTSTAQRCPDSGIFGASVLTDGAVVANAFDLAEKYAVNGPADPGDLVLLDSSASATVMRTSGIPYDPKLIGIVSTRPGFVLGWNEGAQVALTGRVPAKVSAMNGEINIGDALTSSNIPGYAMKATKPGMIVGFALDSAYTTSTIEVFVDVGYSAGSVLKTDGTISLIDDDIMIAPRGTASSTEPAIDSWGLTFRGSAWDASSTTAVNRDFILGTNVISVTSSLFTFKNDSGTALLSLDQGGNTIVNGDLQVGGRLFPSSKGAKQDQYYIFLDNQAPTGTYMATNADGWQSLDTYDFAERFYSPDALDAGDLVVVKTTGQHHVQRAWDESQMLVGIVSTRPAFIAGRPATNTYPIALAGRVPTKVSTLGGNIKAGDPLAPSTIPGVAVKATKTGPIVGLALEDYSSQEIGKIEVNVNPGWWTAPEAAAAPVVNQTTVYQTTQVTDGTMRRGLAKIDAGVKKVHVTFETINAYPFVQVTPRGLLVGAWGTENYSDTGFDIVMSEAQSFDAYFSWQVEPLQTGDRLYQSDGTYLDLNQMTGQPIGNTVATGTVPVADPIPPADTTTTTTEAAASSTTP